MSEKAMLLSGWADEAGVITAVCHARPDGDAAGCVTAVVSYLRECRGKDAVMILPESVPETLGFVFGGNTPLTASSEP